MTTKPPPTDLPIHAFSSNLALESFLEREHKTAPGFHLKLAKKASGITSVLFPEAVETALCYGWIDGQANPFDDKWWLVRFTPRRPKSIWSQKNVKTVARLSEEGRIRPAGLAAIEAAKADGRWDNAYAGPATIKVHDDLAAALAGQPSAAAFLESMNKTDRFSVLFRVQTASTSNRAKKIEEIVKLLAEGRNPASSSKRVIKSKPKPATENRVNKKLLTKPQDKGRSPKVTSPRKLQQSRAGTREGLRSRTKEDNS